MTTAMTASRRHGRHRPRASRVVIAAATLMLCIAAGLAWSATRGGHRRLTDAKTGNARPVAVSPDASGQQQDALAAAAMPTLDPAAALPHPLDPDLTGTAIELPSANSSSAGVDTGFARTPSGAIAQLAAIDAAALAGMNPAQVENVYAAFAEPGADDVETWSTYRFARQTLATAGIPGGSSRVDATYSVSEAQVKGTLDDGRFVLACVNGEFDLSLDDELTRVGAADCARMVWTENGWRIGAGPQPAEPPNAWPGTADAARVGWRPLTRAR